MEAPRITHVKQQHVFWCKSCASTLPRMTLKQLVRHLLHAHGIITSKETQRERVRVSEERAHDRKTITYHLTLQSPKGETITLIDKSVVPGYGWYF